MRTEVGARMWRWVDEFGLAPTERSRWQLDRSQIDLAVACYFPDAGADVLALIAQWYAWILQIDDIYDDRPSDYRPAQWSAALDALIAILGPDGGQGGGAFGAALADLWQRTCSGRSRGWCERLGRNVSAYLGCYHADMVARDRDSLPDIGEYLELRTDSYAMLLSTNFAELAAGADLPDRVHGCAEFAELRRITGLHGGLINDIFSYRKEMLNDYPYNAVHILRTARNCSVQEAVDGVNELATNCIERFIDLERRLPATLTAIEVEQATIADALRSVSVFGSMLRGNLEWCRVVTRYAEPSDSAAWFEELAPADGFGAGIEQVATSPARGALEVIDGPVHDPYRDKVERVYYDEPRVWQQVIGKELWFQFGVYDGVPPPVSLDEAGRRYFDRQLDFAGVTAPTSQPIRRVLDIGCGWGTVLGHLAQRFPECPRLDGVNVSSTQLEYAANSLADRGLLQRVTLYLCNAQDIDQLPAPDQPYDLVVMRGSITHFTYPVFEATMSRLSGRVRPGGTLIISENLYDVDLGEYVSPIPDPIDRLACGSRKTLEYLTATLEGNSFALRDVRKLPSSDEAIRWIQQIKCNVEESFPHGASGVMEELHEHTRNLTAALRKGLISIYSIIATRMPE